MLSLIQAHLQAIHRSQAPDIAPFLLDSPALEAVMGQMPRGADEWVLVRDTEEGLDLGVYIAEDRLAELNAVHSPQEAIENCFGAFCAATEGVSHFLVLVEHAQRQQPIRLLELEFLAEIDKFVSAWLHRRGDGHALGRQLFRHAELREGLSADERWRYREAGRLAEGVCRWLVESRDVATLLEAVRRLWDLPGSARLMEARRRVGLTF